MKNRRWMHPEREEVVAFNNNFLRRNFSNNVIVIIDHLIFI
jgi:hypothetical protein